jgi:hypothetical protein
MLKTLFFSVTMLACANALAEVKLPSMGDRNFENFIKIDKLDPKANEYKSTMSLYFADSLPTINKQCLKTSKPQKPNEFDLYIGILNTGLLTGAIASPDDGYAACVLSAIVNTLKFPQHSGQVYFYSIHIGERTLKNQRITQTSAIGNWKDEKKSKFLHISSDGFVFECVKYKDESYPGIFIGEMSTQGHLVWQAIYSRFDDEIIDYHELNPGMFPETTPINISKDGKKMKITRAAGADNLVKTDDKIPQQCFELW